jgi:hypothetical protein
MVAKKALPGYSIDKRINPIGRVGNFVPAHSAGDKRRRNENKK